MDLRERHRKNRDAHRRRAHPGREISRAQIRKTRSRRKSGSAAVEPQKGDGTNGRCRSTRGSGKSRTTNKTGTHSGRGFTVGVAGAEGTLGRSADRSTTQHFAGQGAVTPALRTQQAATAQSAPPCAASMGIAPHNASHSPRRAAIVRLKRGGIEGGISGQFKV